MLRSTPPTPAEVRELFVRAEILKAAGEDADGRRAYETAVVWSGQIQEPRTDRIDGRLWVRKEGK